MVSHNSGIKSQNFEVGKEKPRFKIYKTKMEGTAPLNPETPNIDFLHRLTRRTV